MHGRNTNGDACQEHHAHRLGATLHPRVAHKGRHVAGVLSVVAATVAGWCLSSLTLSQGLGEPGAPTRSFRKTALRSSVGRSASRNHTAVPDACRGGCVYRWCSCRLARKEWRFARSDAIWRFDRLSRGQCQLQAASSFCVSLSPSPLSPQLTKKENWAGSASMDTRRGENRRKSIQRGTS